MQKVSHTFYILFQNQVGIPWYIQWLIYFTVILVPIFEKISTALFILLGFGFIFYFFRKLIRRKTRLIDNKTLEFETEQFLNSLKSKP